MLSLVNEKIKLFLILLAVTSFSLINTARALQAPPYDLEARFVQIEKDKLFILWITPHKDWYFYGPQKRNIGQPTTITAWLGNKPLPVFYPPTQAKKDYFNPATTVQAYTKKTPFFIKLPTSYSTNSNSNLKIKIRMLLCSPTSCYPVNAQFNFLLQNPNSKLAPAWKSLWEQSQVLPPDFKAESALPGLEVSSLGKAMLLGLIAGFLLNFMPCVLPVLGLKLRSFQNLSKEEQKEKSKEFRLHNIFFILGVLIYFSALGIFLAYTKLNWGAIFQNSLFILATLFLLFLLALSLFGFFTLPILNLKANVKHPYLDSFLTGLLITLLATPCSGPFLGGVLAWSLLNSPTVILLVFISIGLGLSLPYFLVALFPKTIQFFPKTSKANLILEKIVAFLLLGTCIYLLSLLPEDLYLKILISLSIVFFLFWLKKELDLPTSWPKLLFNILILLSIILALFWTNLRPDKPQIWINYEPNYFLSQLGKKNILVDFTANWCPTCKFLEKTVLTETFLSRIKTNYHLLLIKVDLSQENPAGEEFLNSLNSKSIPLVAIFTAHAPDKPLIFRDFFTQKMLEKSLQEKLSPPQNSP
ncbi:MAG: hypothetical protein PWR24_419 [Desulfonauticus sp.]|jgi:thiol:disulfide interchange protein DsbD|nr:MAG: Protein-disulfide reductase [Desulfonauticus sp. 38_4375]MDK2920862.1 hypothetical protein [Desulfonauticus sp.]